jgi:hypothetical protein
VAGSLYLSVQFYSIQFCLLLTRRRNSCSPSALPCTNPRLAIHEIYCSCRLRLCLFLWQFTRGYGGAMKAFRIVILFAARALAQAALSTCAVRDPHSLFSSFLLSYTANNSAVVRGQISRYCKQEQFIRLSNIATSNDWTYHP